MEVEVTVFKPAARHNVIRFTSAPSVNIEGVPIVYQGSLWAQQEPRGYWGERRSSINERWIFHGANGG